MLIKKLTLGDKLGIAGKNRKSGLKDKIKAKGKRLKAKATKGRN